MTECPSCDFENADQAHICEKCGAALYGADPVCSMPTFADTSVGQVLDRRFVIARQIAIDSMGGLYEAEDAEQDIAVLIRALPKTLADNRDHIDKLRRQAQTSAALRSPNIAALLGFELKGPVKYIVTEYIEGMTLEEKISAEGPLSIERMIEIFTPVAEAIDYAHSENRFHRDINPANIILTADQTAKLANFGITGQLKDSLGRIGSDQAPDASLYMAPEQFKTAKPRAGSDIYSLAATIYRCLCRPPLVWRGWIEYQVLKEKPAPLDNLSDGQNAALLKALSRESKNRQRSASKLLADLRPISTPATAAVAMPEEKAKDYAKAIAQAQEKLKAEAQARLKAQETLQAQTQARLDAEQEAQSQATARAQAEEKLKAEALARAEAQKQIKTYTETINRIEADAHKKQNDYAEQIARAKEKLSAEVQTRLNTEKNLEAEALAKAEAQKQIKTYTETISRIEADARKKQNDYAEQIARAKEKLSTEVRTRLNTEKNLEAEAEKLKKLKNESAQAIARARTQAQDFYAAIIAQAREKLKVEAEARAKAEKNADREAEKRALLETKLKEKADAKAEKLAKKEAKANAKAQAEKRAYVQAIAEAKEQARTEALAKAEAQKKLKLEAKARSEAEERVLAQAKAKSETEEKLRAEANARSEAEEKLKAQARAKAEAEKNLKAEARARSAAEEKLRTEARARSKAEEKLKAEANAKSEVEEELKAEARARSEAEEKLKAEVNAKSEVEEELKAEANVIYEAHEQIRTCAEELVEAQQNLIGEPAGRSAFDDRAEQLTRTAGAAEEKIRKPASRLKRFVAVLAFVAIVVFAGPPAYQYIRSQMAPSEAKGAWTQAKSSAEREDYEKAIQTADEIIAKFPRYAQKQDIAQTKTEWQQTLGALELWLQIEQSARQSQYERAILSAGKLLRDYPNSSYAGQVKAKLPLWQNIVSVSKQVIVLLTEAWNAKEARNLDAALASVMSALELDPNNAAARVLRAQVEAEKEAEDQIRQIAAEKQRQFENLKANAIASVSKKDWESAISLYTKASALHPDDPDVTDKLALSRFNLHLSDANSAEAEGDLKAAIHSYTKALSQTSSPVVRKELESAMSALQTHLEAEQMRLLLAQHLKMASEAEAKGDFAAAVKWCEKAAEAGNDNAMYKLGLARLNGNGLPRDLSKALEWFGKAADAGNGDAMFKLGLAYYGGEGVEKDHVKAVEWYEKAAKAGSSEAMHNLGAMYYSGESMPKNSRKAVDWLARAAEQGNTQAMYNLAVAYYNGDGIAKDYPQAVEWFRKSAEAGNTSAMYNLALAYLDVTDYMNAKRWFIKAAEAGNAEAMYNLGVMHQNGYGVARHDTKAVEWYKKAAEAGDTNAMVNLGLMHHNGQGTSKDPDRAADWYRKGAERGNTRAMSNLAMAYYNGDGIDKDQEKAVEWLTKAAQLGEKMAMFNIAMMHQNGWGVPKDPAKAVEWYKKASKTGDPQAMYNLALMYRKGQGVTKDAEKSLSWLQEAANLGHAQAKNELVKLGKTW